MALTIREPLRLEIKDVLMLNKLFVKEEKQYQNEVTEIIRCKRRDYDSQIIIYFQEALTKKNRKIYVLVNESDVIVGYIVGHCKQDINNFFTMKVVGVIDSIYVREDYRGDNCGKRLMQEMEQWLIKMGSEVIYLDYLCPNDKAYLFYEKLNYVPLTTRLTKHIK